MLLHPDMMLDLANARNRELIAEADRGRLLRRAWWSRARRAAKTTQVRGRPTGNLASCERPVAAPAR
ncbi:hypothetical protein [Actinoplanes sp. NPDC049802]|uniref:hypothetical protein n=1 Tax=Actinoplanes sp. NPDC049802 TaxID=3154742 RepID=UPI0033FD01E7